MNSTCDHFWSHVISIVHFCPLVFVSRDYSSICPILVAPLHDVSSIPHHLSIFSRVLFVVSPSFSSLPLAWEYSSSLAAGPSFIDSSLCNKRRRQETGKRQRERDREERYKKIWREGERVEEITDRERKI